MTAPGTRRKAAAARAGGPAEVATANAALASRAADLAGQHEPRTPGRRAAAAVQVALATTGTPAAARRALATVRDPEVRAAAVTLLGQLTAAEQPRTKRTERETP